MPLFLFYIKAEREKYIPKEFDPREKTKLETYEPLKIEKIIEETIEEDAAKLKAEKLTTQVTSTVKLCFIIKIINFF